MRRRSNFFFDRLFAVLTILSLSLTPIQPAWALRPPASVEGTTGKGLEERLREVPSGVLGTTATLGVREAATRTLSAQDRRLLLEAEQFLAGLGDTQSNLREQVLAGVAFLRDRSNRLNSWFEGVDVAAQLDALIGSAPVNCATCGGDAIAHILSDPEFALPEDQQSPEFNRRELETALLILRQLMRTKGIAFVERQHDGQTHRVLADSLLDIKGRLEDAQRELPAGSRAQWNGYAVSANDLDRVAATGFTMAHLDGNHFVLVTGVTPDSVTFTEPAVNPDSGLTETREVTVPRAEFIARWTRGQRTGVALVGVPAGQRLRGIQRLKDAELAPVLGSCGVVNFAQPLGEGALISLGPLNRPGYSIFQSAMEAIRLLEPRGFDNAAMLIKYMLPLKDIPGADKVTATPELRAWARANRVHLAVDGQNRIIGLRFFGVARVTGAATTNEAFMRKQIAEHIQRMVPDFCRRAGLPEVRVGNQEEVSADFPLIMRGKGGVDFVVGRVAALGVYLHTRFATKGGYQRANAHHWEVEFEGGIWSLSHNGDWDTYDWVRPYFQQRLGVKFEGTTDSEVLLHLLARMAVTRTPSGKVIRIEPPAVAVVRLFRLIDVLEVLKVVGLQMEEIEDQMEKLRGQLTGNAATDGPIQAQIETLEAACEGMRQQLLAAGIDASNGDLLPTVGFGPTEKISRAFERVLERALRNPGMYDKPATATSPGYVAFNELDGQPVTPMGLGAYLAKKAPPQFRGVFGKGLNITIQVASANDPSGGVIARTYPDATAGYFVARRNAQGKIVQLATASEIRGVAPQAGEPVKRITVAEEMDVVYGKAEKRDVPAWSVEVTDGLNVRSAPVWSGTTGATEVDIEATLEKADAAWVEVTGPKGQRMFDELSPYEIEAMVGHATVTTTIDEYTKDAGRGLLLPNVAKIGREVGVTSEVLDRLGDPETNAVSTGSGSSTFTVMIADAAAPFSHRIESTDNLRMNPDPGLITSKTVLIVVSQSGETGAARKLVEQVKAAGGIVIVVTNTPGSSLYNQGKSSAGVLLTYSTPEGAVAATGTTLHQTILLRLLGLEVLRRQGILNDNEVSEEVKKIRGLGTRVVQRSGPAGQPIFEQQPGTLAEVLVSPGGFFSSAARVPGSNSFYQRTMNIFEYLRANAQRTHSVGTPGYGDDYRPCNFTIIGFGDEGIQTAKEGTLKNLEQIGHDAMATSAAQTLEEGFAETNGQTQAGAPVQPLWDPSTVTETVRANRSAFALDDIPLDPAPIERIMIVGNASDENVARAVKDNYQHVCPAQIEFMTYEQAATKARGKYKPPAGTLVIYVRPGEARVRNLPAGDPKAEDLARLAQAVANRWDIDAGLHITLVSQEPTTSVAAELGRQMGNVRALQGDPKDKEFAVMAALDRIISRLTVRSSIEHPELPAAKGAAEFVDQQQQLHDRAVQSGIQETIVACTTDTGFNNQAIERLTGAMAARAGTLGWGNQNGWPLGYGPLQAMAFDLSVQMRLRLGESPYAENKSNASHGFYAGMHKGKEVIFGKHPVAWQIPKFGADDKKKTAELMPRAVTNAFPQEKEPGIYVAITTKEQADKINQPEEVYRALRRMRHQAQESATGPGGIKITADMPDVAIATPNGDLFESLVLNRLLVNRIAVARAKRLQAVGMPWSTPRDSGAQRARRGELVIVMDPGGPAQHRALFYEQLRRDFPRWDNVIVTLCPKNSDRSVFAESDIVFDLPTGDPTEIMACVHGISAVLARARYVNIANRAAAVAQAIDAELALPHRGIFGPSATPSPETGFDVPGNEQFVGGVEIMRIYAQLAQRRSEDLSPPERDLKDRITRAIGALESKSKALKPGEVFSLLDDAIEIYRVDLVPVFGFAHDPALLIKYLIFQIQGLAKVVTNLGGVTVRQPLDNPQIIEATVGQLARGEVADDVAISALAEAIRTDARVRDHLEPVLTAQGLPITAEEEAGELARRFWNAAKPVLARLANDLSAGRAALDQVPVTLGAGFAAAAATDPGAHGFVLDFAALTSPALARQLMEDELQHLRTTSEVRSIPVDTVSLEGVPDDLRGQAPDLVRQAIAEAALLLGQSQRFAALPQREQAGLIRAISGITPLQATPAYRALMAGSNQDNMTPERFWQAIDVVADTPAYGPVAVIADLMREQRERIGDAVWRAGTPMVRTAISGLEEGQVTPDMMTDAAGRQWTYDAASNRFRTRQGGWVSPNAFYGVEPTAEIRNGSWVRGAASRIEARVVLDNGALVENAAVLEGARLNGATVRSDAAQADDWNWNNDYKVDEFAKGRVQAELAAGRPVTVIGRDARIEMGPDREPAVITNATIGERTSVTGGSVTNCVIGAENTIARAKLTLTHTEDNVTIKTKNGAPTEVSESWLGWGCTIDSEGYFELLAPNLFRRAYLDASMNVQYETVEDIPAVVLASFAAIFASFDMTGKIGKELASSRHGEGIVMPGAVIGAVTNIIMHVHPKLQSPADFFGPASTNKNMVLGQLTALHPLSYSHKLAGDPDRAVGEVWGAVLHGASRYGLNTPDAKVLWMFENARPAIAAIQQTMRDRIQAHAKTAGWDGGRLAAALAHVDNLPRYALETGKALAHADGDLVLEGRYDQHLAGTGPELQRLTLDDLLRTDDPAESDYLSRPLFSPADAAALNGLPAGLDVRPNCNIGPGARVIGRGILDGVTVPAGAVVFVHNAIVQNSELADGVEIRTGVLRDTQVAQGAKLSAVSAEGATIGERASVAGAVLTRTTVGEKAKVEPYARATDTKLGARVAFGGIAENCDLANGTTCHHLARTRLRWVTTQGLQLQVTDAAGTRTVNVDTATNISAGTVALGTEQQPIVLNNAMLGANVTLPPGTTVGFMAFVKNMGQSTPAFAMSRKPGPAGITIGVTLNTASMAWRMLSKMGVNNLSAEERAAFNERFDQELAAQSLDAQRDGRWTLPLTGNLQSVADVGDPAQGKWEFRPRFQPLADDKGYGPNPQLDWVKTGSAAGNEEPTIQAGLDEFQMPEPAPEIEAAQPISVENAPVVAQAVAGGAGAQARVAATEGYRSIADVAQAFVDFGVRRHTVSEQVTAAKTLIVTPDGLAKLSLAFTLNAPPAQPLLVEVIANDAAHQSHVQQLLAAMNIPGMQFNVHHLQEPRFAGNLGRAVDFFRAQHRGRSLNPLVVDQRLDLQVLFRFLGVPEAIADIAAYEAIVANSQSVWA